MPVAPGSRVVDGDQELVNDLLIALSARSIGAAVVTSNVRDFGAMSEVRRFPLIIVPA